MDHGDGEESDGEDWRSEMKTIDWKNQFDSSEWKCSKYPCIRVGIDLPWCKYPCIYPPKNSVQCLISKWIGISIIFKKR